MSYTHMLASARLQDSHWIALLSSSIRSIYITIYLLIVFVSVFSYPHCLTIGKGAVKYSLFAVSTTTEDDDDDDDAEDDDDKDLPWSALLVSQYQLPLTTTMKTMMLMGI